MTAPTSESSSSLSTVDLGVAPATERVEATSLRDLTPQQWKSGIAAWLGWLFDGLDMHIYTLVGVPFVAVLMHSVVTDPEVTKRGSWIQASFMIGWALGGGFFGRVGDVLGRSKALGLTILTYALFTGLSFFATQWWHLLIFRFLSALGVGGEWAVGSAMLAETWPKKWRPWIAAVLQTGVNLGVILACISASLLAVFPYRVVFLVGAAPALLVFFIRKHVPEPAEWHEAKLSVQGREQPKMLDLLRGSVRRSTLLAVVVCACSLTGWWAFLFWNPQHLKNLPELKSWTTVDRDRLTYYSVLLIIGVSIAGNFFAAWLARRVGYRTCISMMCGGLFLTAFTTYAVPRGHVSLMFWMSCVGFFSGVFGLFTMYLPALFPVLLRTTGAGFSYNIGRVAAAAGTIIFGLFAHIGDFRLPLLIDSFLFIPPMLVAMLLPDLRDN